jgi:hypothetical protein
MGRNTEENDVERLHTFLSAARELNMVGTTLRGHITRGRLKPAFRTVTGDRELFRPAAVRQLAADLRRERSKP